MQERILATLWFFLPERSIAHDVRLRNLMASTFLSDGSRQGLRYGALVAIVTRGGSTLDSALLGAFALMPPAFLGMYGGAIADRLPRRAALITIYILQAVACLTLPFIFGTGFWSVAFLVFAINVLGQVSGPSERSLSPLVAPDHQVAGANALLSLSSNVGAAFGTAVLAPVLVRIAGVEALFVVCGILLLLAANRVLGLHDLEDQPGRPRNRSEASISGAVRWLLSEPAIATMVVLSVVAGIANVIIEVLAPQYVASVLDVDASNAVYVFAPAALGLLLALAAAPSAIRVFGERPTAAAGFAVAASALFSLGLVRESFATVVDPVNPLRLLGLAGLDLGARMRTTGFLAMPLGFGVSLTNIAVQTYINRRVPLSMQGRTFALQSTLKNGLAIAPLLLLGSIAAVASVSRVLLLSPLVLYIVALCLVKVANRFGDTSAATPGLALDSFRRQAEPIPPSPSPFQ